MKSVLIANRGEIAVRVVGSSEADLFANSAFALFDVMVDVQAIEARERLPIEVEGADRDDLIVNWVRELLYLYQGSGYLLNHFEIREVRDTVVRAEVLGEKCYPRLEDIPHPVEIVDGPHALKERHLRMTFSQEGRRFRAIAWRAAERAEFLGKHRAGVNLAYSLERNEFQGETYLELAVADIKALEDVQ